MGITGWRLWPITTDDPCIRLVGPHRMRYAPVCETGRHSYHGHVPWQHGTLYDRQCVVSGCSIPAANSPAATPLCDCHFEDWSGFATLHHLSSTGRQWTALFSAFLAEIDKGQAA